MPNLSPQSDFASRTTPTVDSTRQSGPAIQATRPGRPRYDYMDSLRAALIIAGVFFHAALPYRTVGHWNVQEALGAVEFDYLAATLTSFRMATFFMVAGFFCALTFSLQKASTNLRRRLLVFGVPLLSFIVAIQPIQFALRWSHEHSSPGASPSGSLEFWRAYFANGAFVSHLWFLVNLIIYYVMVRAAMEILERSPTIREGFRKLLMSLPAALLRSKTILSLASVVLVEPWLRLASKWLPVVPGLDTSELLAYLPFFLVGFLLYKSPKAMDEFCVVRFADFLVLIGAIGFWGSGWFTDHFLQELLIAIISWQAAWTIGASLLAAFRRWFNVENPAVRAISEASYTIYLFHHLVVIALATMFLGVAVPGGLAAKYGLVVAMTCVITFTLHHFVIRKSMILSRLFNGRPAPLPAAKLAR
jgi:glucans biosynthesis protein C